MSSTPFKDLIAAAAEAKYVVIPSADYAVVVRDANATTSSTGKDMIKLAVKVAVGPHAGASVLTQQTLSPDNPAAIAIFLKFLGAFGIDEETLAGLRREDGGPNIAAVCALLKGRVAMATVGIHNWNDEDRNDINKFKKLTPEMQAAVDEAIASGAVTGVGGGAADPFAAAAAAPVTADASAGKNPADPF